MIRKCIIVLVSIVAIIVSIDLIVGAFSKQLILDTHDVGVNQTNAVQAMFKRDMDVLILGPSSANHHYNCKIIEDSLHQKAYNAGRDGQNIVYSYMVLAATLEHHVPQNVILDMSGVMLDGSWNSHLRDMNCFYGISNHVDDIIDDVNDWKGRLKLHSNLYRYNNTFPWILNGYFAQSQAELNGYRPLPSHQGDINKIERCLEFHLDSTDFKYMNMLVKTCKTNKINLLVCVSPSLYVEKGVFINYLRDFCNKNNVSFYNWNGDDHYTDRPELFYDYSHLNEVGADIFTRELIGLLKNDRI